MRSSLMLMFQSQDCSIKNEKLLHVIVYYYETFLRKISHLSLGLETIRVMRFMIDLMWVAFCICIRHRKMLQELTGYAFRMLWTRITLLFPNEKKHYYSSLSLYWWIWNTWLSSWWYHGLFLVSFWTLGYYVQFCFMACRYHFLVTPTHAHILMHKHNHPRTPSPHPRIYTHSRTSRTRPHTRTLTHSLSLSRCLVSHGFDPFIWL